MLDPAPDDSPLVGRKIGRFRVVSRLGQGGIATVWKAQDELLGRTVALKLLDDSLAGNTKTRRRFVHDAQAASLLDHPGIVTVYDAGESGGHAYIALTFVDGDTVSDLAARRLMPVDEAVRIAIAAAEALEHAHGRGVVHRDVTGRNIMVAKDGRVFVLDFSLAFAVGMTRLTSSETTLGTVAYMSPEAFSGSDIDARSDIYGLGVVLFEALTGAFPFMGERPEIVAFAKLNNPPRRPSALRPDVPPALDRIVLRAMARQRDERYARVGLMLEDLRELAESLRAGSGAGPPAAPRTGAPDPEAPVTGAPPAAADAAEHAGPMYLAIPPFQVQGAGEDPEDVQGLLARRLPETLGAALGGEVHVVPSPKLATPEAPGPELARQLGANALLAGTVSRSGTRVRVTFSVRDLWRGAQVAGDVVDGSALQVFDLEDAVVASVRQALGLRASAPARDPARARRPDPAAADHYALALTHLERHDDEASLDAAIKLLEELEAADPAQARYPATLARVCLRKQTLTGSRVWQTKAANACERARQVDGALFETRLALAELASAGGRAEDAIAVFRELGEQRPESAEPCLGLARALFLLGRYDDAEGVCEEAIRRRPDDWRGYGRLGFVRYGRGDSRGALEAWRIVLQLVPDSLRGRMNVAGALYKLDRPEEAVAEFGEVLKRKPNAEAYWNAGTILYHLGRDVEAIEMLERAVVMGPEKPLSWGNLGNACRQVPGKETRAREALEMAVALAGEELERNPASAELRARMAGWLTGLGLNERAKTEIERAVRDAPEDVVVLNTAGHVYLLLGDPTAAVQRLTAAVRRGFSVQGLRRSRELAVLHANPEFRALLEVAEEERSDPGDHASP